MGPVKWLIILLILENSDFTLCNTGWQTLKDENFLNRIVNWFDRILSRAIKALVISIIII